jgi:hypothetical protein
MAEAQEVLGWRGWSVVDRDGEAVGTVAEIYLEPGSEEPNWLLLDVKGFRAEPAFVPARLAEAAGEGLKLAVARELVTEAPRPTADGRLSAAEAAGLRAHYGPAASGG